MICRPQTVLAAFLLACDGLLGGTVVDEFNAAKQMAGREGKDIVLGFSGYRWWALTDAIATDHENDWVRKRFIMLNVPATRGPVDAGGGVSADEKAVIDLRKKFHQKLEEPYPAILLLDATGRPYAELCSHEQPVDVYIPELKAAVARRAARDAAFSHASEESDLKKAALLSEGLQRLTETRHSYGLEELVTNYYQDVVAEIIGNDPKDTLGWAKAREEQKNFESEARLTKSTDDQLRELADDINRIISAGTTAPEVFIVIESFLRDRPEFPVPGRQRALIGKVEAALILRDYGAALKAWNGLASAFPDSEGIKNLSSKIKSELEKAQQLSESGADAAVSDYSIRFRLDAVEKFDADGSRTRKELKEADRDFGRLLVEDQMNRLLRKTDLLLRLGEHEQALRTLDAFVACTPSSGQVRNRDRIYRPFILRGLNEKRPVGGHPPRGEQGDAGEPASRPESKPEGGDKPQPESERRSR